MFSDVDRADILFRLGACRLELSSIQTAIGLFNEALALAERSELPCDRLRAEILRLRSRCYRRQRDYEAARGRPRARARALAEASVTPPPSPASTSRRRSSPSGRASGSSPANTPSRPRRSTRRSQTAPPLGRVLNNLGGINFLLGKPEEAIEQLNESFKVLLEYGSEADAARAVSSLAQVQLRTGQLESAEEQARQALKLLGDRVDVIDEIGSAHLVLGRSLLEQGRLDEAAEAFDVAAAALRPAFVHQPPCVRLGSPRATSRPGAVRTSWPRSSIGAPPKRSRTSGSRKERR